MTTFISVPALALVLSGEAHENHVEAKSEYLHANAHAANLVRGKLNSGEGLALSDTFKLETPAGQLKLSLNSVQSKKGFGGDVTCYGFSGVLRDNGSEFGDHYFFEASATEVANGVFNVSEICGTEMRMAGVVPNEGLDGFFHCAFQK